MRRRLAIATMCLFLLQAASAQPVFVAVAPDLPGDVEAFAVAGVDGTRWPLTGHRVTDGEGSFVFAADAVADAVPVWITSDAAGWRSLGAPEAAPGWSDARLRLADAGDVLVLLGPNGDVLDSVAWGRGTALSYRSEGFVMQRVQDGQGAWVVGTDADWAAPRAHRVGESALPTASFDVCCLTAYRAPDAAFDVLSDLIREARERLHLHVYDFRHPGLADEFVEALAARPALDVQVLVEGRPAGMGASDRAARDVLLGGLVAAGAAVHRAEGGPYRYHHLKVLVADDAVAVQSENWVTSSVPEGGAGSSRGWGVVVHDAAVADWFAAWMADDRRLWGIEPAGVAEGPGPVRLPARHGAAQAEPVTLSGGFRVTPIVAPEHAAAPWLDPVAQRVDGASHRVWTQQLTWALTESAPTGWNAADRHHTGMTKAAERGVDVRLHVAHPPDATPPGWADWATTFDLPGLRLHNKGWIVDEAVVVGSLNANHASRSANREVSLLLEGAGVADVYAAWFLEDEHALRDDGPPAPWPILLVPLWVAWRRLRAS